MSNKTSHDQNFKNLILDYPHQALAFFARDESTVIFIWSLRTYKPNWISYPLISL